ncbi:GntR family transcriptional regulator [Marinomonas agarivorans]|nr:GntR family transcriptional regulator [Marinomonas agarivorans]
MTLHSSTELTSTTSVAKNTENHSTSRTLPEDLLIHLQQAIISGELPLGSKISEAELAKRYQVSRGPLREALVKLETLGLITRSANVGARVIQLKQEDVIYHFQIREALEGMAARLAAENIESQELQALYDLLDVHEQTVNDPEANQSMHQSGNFDFHLRIIKASKNPQLISMLTDKLYAMIRLFRHQISTHRTDPKQALQEHKMLLDAIANREGDLAELLMRRHISRAASLLVMTLKDTSVNSHPSLQADRQDSHQSIHSSNKHKKG